MFDPDLFVLGVRGVELGVDGCDCWTTSMTVSEKKKIHSIHVIFDKTNSNMSYTNVFYKLKSHELEPICHFADD